MERIAVALSSYELFDNSVRVWVVAIASALFALLIVWLARRLARKRFANARETSSQVDDVILELAERTRLVLLALVIAYISFQLLELPPKAAGTLRAIAVVAFFAQIGFWLGGVVELWLRRYRRTRVEADPSAATTIGVAGLVAKIGLWAVVVLVALDNLGVNVTALVAGLGIGGVAVALALQNILGDLFASLSIVVDKPFVPGDFIIVGDQAGRVRSVGLKTTRITSINGEELVFSNSDLLQSRIRNFSLMQERRVLSTLNVTYQTSREQLEKIPSIVRAAVEKRELTRFDRAHFKTFGPHSLDFEVVYYVLSAEYPIYMDVQQAINLELVTEFAREGIDFAYPTQMLYLNPVRSRAQGDPSAGRPVATDGPGKDT